MIEKNPFRYFLPAGASKLIVGSFPCYNGTGYGDWFYSGSGKNYFWRLLSDILKMPATNRKQKMALCEKYRIALTDIAYRVERTKNNCSDSNLRIVEFNRKGIDTCLKAGIDRIFFTSRFVEKQFEKNYPLLRIPSFVLVSPSPAANKHIGGLKEFKDLVAGKTIGSTYEYRLIKYRELLCEPEP
jgi:G:T/U-mismatch repair DNA glycosylase